MSKIEVAHDVLLKALTEKSNVLADAFDVAARENNEDLAAELSEKCVRIDWALSALAEIAKTLRAV